MNRHDELLEALRLPRPQRRLRRLADRLCEGHTVLWFLPRQAPVEELITALEEHCRGRAEVGSAYVPDPVTWPEKWLMEHFGVEGDPWGEEAVQALQRAPEMPSVLILRNLDRIRQDGLGQWQRFLSDWARSNRRPGLEPFERKALLVPVSKLRTVLVLDESPEDPLLDKVWYWGWVTPREVRMVAAEYLRERSQVGAAGLWGEAVWASLAGADLDFFIWIAGNADVTLPLSELLGRLKTYGEQRGYSALLSPSEEGVPPAWLGNGVGAYGEELEPTPSLRALWLSGGLDWHEESGYGLHSALLSMDGRRTELLRRIWRGQAAVLLPMIDQHRIAVSRELARLDRSWVAFLQANMTREASDSLDNLEPVAEFGEILEFLDRQERTTSLRELRRNVDAIRRTRNVLAHYQPVEWPAFQHVCEQYWQYARASLRQWDELQEVTRP